MKVHNIADAKYDRGGKWMDQSFVCYAREITEVRDDLSFRELCGKKAEWSRWLTFRRRRVK